MTVLKMFCIISVFCNVTKITDIIDISQYKQHIFWFVDYGDIGAIGHFSVCQISAQMDGQHILTVYLIVIN